MNFAVIKTGGKQYKVYANDVLKIEKLEGAQPGDVVTFDQVLMVGTADDVTVGTPLVAGASVAAHFVGTRKNRTVIIQKKERRQHFDRRNGHRQRLSTVRIGEILLSGAKPTLAADERLQARHAALLASTAAVEAPAPQAPAPAKVARPKAAKPAPPEGDAVEAPAPKTKRAPAKKAAAKTAEATTAKADDAAATEKKPAARKKAAPKGDKE
jgi:large subunit ribosomal protein L21